MDEDLKVAINVLGLLVEMIGGEISIDEAEYRRFVDKATACDMVIRLDRSGLPGGRYVLKLVKNSCSDSSDG